MVICDVSVSFTNKRVRFSHADAGAIWTVGDTWVSGSTGFDESTESSWAAGPVGARGFERATEPISARRAIGAYEPDWPV